jgi:lysophospholipase L1-like esterase
MPLRKKVIFSLVWTALLLGVLEGGLRFYANVRAEGTRGRGLPPPAERRDYQVLDPVLGYALKPGYSANGISINSLGFRGSEVTPEKPRGTTRIFAIGDSTTFGLSGDDCPYPFQMQRILDGQYGLGRFQVINAGVEGYGVDYALRLLDSRISTLSPDIVIFYIGWNDLYSTNPYNPKLPDHSEQMNPESRDLSWNARMLYALDALYITKAVKKVIYVYLPSVLPANHFSVSPKFTTYFRTRLRQMIDTSRKMHARPVVLTLPTLLSKQMSSSAIAMLHYPWLARGDRGFFLEMYQQFEDAIRETAQAEAVPLIDAASYFAELNRDGLFFDTLHMHCDGYGELARYVVSELRRQRLLSKRREATS